MDIEWKAPFTNTCMLENQQRLKELRIYIQPRSATNCSTEDFRVG